MTNRGSLTGNGLLKKRIIENEGNFDGEVATADLA